MNRPNESDASECPEILALQAEMDGFASEKAACEQKTRELMAAEDPARGVFHAQEIFALRRDKLRLEVEMEFRRKKINRIRLGITEEDMLRSHQGLAF